jgi:hypothetical protein
VIGGDCFDPNRLHSEEDDQQELPRHSLAASVASVLDCPLSIEAWGATYLDFAESSLDIP